MNIQHFLRTFVVMSELIDDPISLLIILEIESANTRHLDRRQRATFSEDIVPDVERRPASPYAVAESLALSPETVRRRVQKLQARRVIQDVEGGVIVPATFWDQREPLISANTHLMRRLSTDLVRTDVADELFKAG